MKIALLLKEHYREHAVQWQNSLLPKVQTEFVSYSTFEELEEMFLRIKRPGGRNLCQWNHALPCA